MTNSCDAFDCDTVGDASRVTPCKNPAENFFLRIGFDYIIQCCAQHAAIWFAVYFNWQEISSDEYVIRSVIQS
jgi:hypothetical protein